MLGQPASWTAQSPSPQLLGKLALRLTDGSGYYQSPGPLPGIALETLSETLSARASYSSHSTDGVTEAQRIIIWQLVREKLAFESQP
jgi:hypothetical protein